MMDAYKTKSRGYLLGVITVVLIYSMTAGAAFAASDQWLERRLGEIEQASALPKAKQIEILGAAARAGVENTGVTLSENQKILSKTAVERLSLIPGHAAYYGDPVMRHLFNVKRLYEAGEILPARAAMFGYTKAMIDMQLVLQMVPSPETVQVLGSMLGETWVSPDKIEGMPGPLCRSAAQAISKLNIANAPTPPMNHSGAIDAGLAAWQQWYAEIESGRRTFRFIGDPVEYDLRGPSKRGAILPGPRNTKRKPETPGGEPASASNQAEVPGYLPYLIGVVFLLAAIFIFLRGKRRIA